MTLSQSPISERPTTLQLSVAYIPLPNLDGSASGVSSVHSIERPVSGPERKVLPFLKWAGGKRWLIESHSDLLRNKGRRFIEPFLGSGAVFFSMQPTRAILSDVNPRLIETYIAIKEAWETVQEHLAVHQKKHSKDYYYLMRDRKCTTPATRAAQFIYLNRTCWNGLYRVNKLGKFNVPIGTKSSVLLASDNFQDVANLLKDANLFCGDFEVSLGQAGEGDFVFVDPPYTVKHNYNGFLKYNEHIFSWDDQLRLRDCVKSAVNRGAEVVVTNACHESIRQIYVGMGEIVKIDRASVIAGKASARGRYEEVIIRCS